MIWEEAIAGQKHVLRALRKAALRGDDLTNPVALQRLQRELRRAELLDMRDRTQRRGDVA